MKNQRLVSTRLLVGSIVLLLAGAVPAFAQPGSGGPAPGAVTSAPIDGGASLLLAAAMGLGLKRLRQRRGERGASSKE